MTDSLHPGGHSGGSKGTALLLIGGAALLIVASTIIYLRRTETPPAPPTETPETVAIAPTQPLVIAPQKPLARTPAEPLDTSAAKTGEEGVPKPTGTVKRRVEKMGTIDAKEVNKYINSRFSSVKMCYERRLKNNPLLEGKLDLNISIAPSGKATSVNVNRDTVGDDEMTACVKRTIRGWNFPKPTGGRVVIGKTFQFKKKR